MSQDVLIYSLLGAAIWCFIMYEIIATASRSKRIVDLQQQQVNLLKKIAETSGVTKEDIEFALNTSEEAK